MSRSKREALPFLLPFLVGFVVLALVPMGVSLALSFAATGGELSAGDLSWVGFDHYRDALAVDLSGEPTDTDPWYWHMLGGRPNDPRFYRSLYNSLFYTFFAVPLGLCASLAVALLLARQRPGMSLVRMIVYMPHVLGGVATLMIWSWLFNPRFGWINHILRFVYDLLDPLVVMITGDGTAGWSTPGWLYSPLWCKPAVVVMSVWTMGGSMLIFLAAIRRVPPNLHDAARLDGAGSWRRLLHITVPQITPAILFNLIFSFIFAMQAFNESYILQNRAQRDGLLFYVRNVYETAFEPPYRIGYASALAWILVVLLVVFVFPLVWTSRRWVHEALSERAR